MKSEVLATFLQQPYIGVIATLRRDGRPFTVPVGWLWKENSCWISGTAVRVWCKQLCRASRCSLCIETTTPFPAHVGIDGRVELLEPPHCDIWPIHKELATKYLAQGPLAGVSSVESFLAVGQTEPRLLFRLFPAVWRTIDPQAYKENTRTEHSKTRLSPRSVNLSDNRAAPDLRCLRNTQRGERISTGMSREVRA